MEYIIIKRILDVIFSIVLVLLLFPLILLIIIAQLSTHGLPILFIQERVGKAEKIFRLYKFRTMTNSKDSYNRLLPDSKRLTPFGKFLRKSSLDELPSFINVIKGEMSLIGPRPLLTEYLPYYSETEKKRHNVLPGISGLAQVNGRNFLNWDDRLKLDVYYVENISFKMDVQIFGETILKILLRKDISADSSEVEPSLIDHRKNHK